DDAIHVNVVAVGRPGIRKQVHADVVNPIAGRHSPYKDVVPDRQVGRAVHVETAGADGDVKLGDLVRRSADGRSGTRAGNLHQRILVAGSRLEDSAGAIGSAADAAQHYTAGADSDRVGAGISPCAQQHGAAKAVGIQRHG